MMCKTYRTEFLFYVNLQKRLPAMTSYTCQTVHQLNNNGSEWSDFSEMVQTYVFHWLVDTVSLFSFDSSHFAMFASRKNKRLNERRRNMSQQLNSFSPLFSSSFEYLKILHFILPSNHPFLLVANYGIQISESCKCICIGVCTVEAENKHVLIGLNDVKARKFFSVFQQSVTFSGCF